MFKEKNYDMPNVKGGLKKNNLQKNRLVLFQVFCFFYWEEISGEHDWIRELSVWEKKIF